MELFEFFTSAEGRLNRAKFWAGLALLTGASLIIYAAIGAFAGPTRGTMMLSISWVVLLFYPTYAVSAKRFQDCGKPGSIAFIGLLAVYTINGLYAFNVLSEANQTPLAQALDLLAVGIGLWFLVELGLLKGTQGPNRYGQDPLGTTKADAAL